MRIDQQHYDTVGILVSDLPLLGLCLIMVYTFAEVWSFTPYTVTLHEPLLYL